MRRPVVASSSPRSIRSQSGSTLGRRAHPHRTAARAGNAARPHLPLLGRRVHGSQGSARTRASSLAIFSIPGTQRDGSATENGAADRGGGGVRCGLRANGDSARRVVRLSTADSLCDRMERGEEEAPTAAVLHFSATISADIKAVRFRRAAAENLRPEIFEARATLRSQRESAVGRRIGKPRMSPFARRPHRTPPPPQPPQVPPRLPGIEECPHFVGGLAPAANFSGSGEYRERPHKIL